MLNVKDVKCSYGNVEVLKGISFEILEGNIVAIIGANGAGKTTTIKALTGLIPITSGSFIFDGKEISNVPAYEMVKLGISQIPEGRQIFPELTVLENIEMGGYTISDSRIVKERIESMFVKFPQLRKRQKQLAGTLSGGEQQMLAISRALISNPRLLLLDEPSMGLSPKLVGEVFDIIEELKANGMTILLVEQNATMALEIADYAYALQIGEIIISGTGREMLANPLVRKAYLAY